MINSETIEQIKQVITEVLSQLGVRASIETREQPGSLIFNIRTPESNILIGQYGMNLSALQYICRVIVRRKISHDLDFVIDVDDYKRKREVNLANLASAIYKDVIKNQRPAILRPMSAYERRIIHATLAEKTDITTSSIGEDPNRMVAVLPSGQSVPTLEANPDFKEEDYILV